MDIYLKNTTGSVKKFKPYMACRTENLFNPNDILEGYTTNGGSASTTILKPLAGRAVAIIPCKPNTTYTFTRSRITSLYGFRVFYYDQYPIANETISLGGEYGNETLLKMVFTTCENASYMMFNLGEIDVVKQTDFMVHEGNGWSVPKDFVPYYKPVKMKPLTATRTKNLLNFAALKNAFDVSTDVVIDYDKGSITHTLISTNQRHFGMTFTPEDFFKFMNVTKPGKYQCSFDSSTGYGHPVWRVYEAGSQVFRFGAGSARDNFEITQDMIDRISGSKSIVTILAYFVAGDTPAVASNFMLVEGEIAQPYEPYYQIY
jgi:hypothetical protein